VTIIHLIRHMAGVCSC